MKKLVLITMLVTSFVAQAQKSYGIVASGGKFEFIAPFTDYASIGVIDFDTKVYTQMDEIFTQSVQSLAISSEADPTIFIAAQDSIVSYTFDVSGFKFIRQAQIPFSGISVIEANENYLLAGKGFGDGDYLVVYDANDLSELYASPIITTSIDDILMLGETLAAVSYNIKSKVNPCADQGWDCSGDSLGRVDIIDLENQVTLITIDLGDRGVGNVTLSNSRNALSGSNLERDFLVCSSSNEMLFYVNENFDIESALSNTGVSKIFNQKNTDEITIGLTTSDSLVYVDYSVGLEGFIEITVADPAFATTYGTQTAVTGGQIVSLRNDFSTATDVIFNNGNDTIAAGISTEDIKIAEFGGVTGLFDAFTASNEQVSAYFAEEVSNLDLSNVVVYSTSGNEVMRLESTEQFEASSLEQGIYILKAEDANDFVTYRVVKQ